MSYPRSLLNDGESIELDIHPHWSTLAVLAVYPVVAILLTSLLGYYGWLSGVGAWFALAVWLGGGLWAGHKIAWYYTTEFVVTSSRVIYRSGLLSKSGIEIPLDRVTNTSVSRKLIERMLGNGDLVIESAGKDGQSRFEDIANTEKVQQLIHRLVEARTHPATSAVVQPLAPQSDSLADQLERITKLHAAGSLGDDEFLAAKNALLGKNSQSGDDSTARSS